MLSLVPTASPSEAKGSDLTWWDKVVMQTTPFMMKVYENSHSTLLAALSELAAVIDSFLSFVFLTSRHNMCIFHILWAINLPAQILKTKLWYLLMWIIFLSLFHISSTFISLFTHIFTFHFPGSSERICLQCRRPRFDPWGRSPRVGNGNPLQYSCLESPMDRRVWRGIVHGVARSRTQLRS